MLSEDQVFMKDKLRQLLQTNAVEVTFKKKDGTIRVMNCTLDHERIPADALKFSGPHFGVRRVNEDVLPVWDLDKSDWRSFRIDSIDMYIVKRSAA